MGDICARVRGNMTAMIWKNKWYVQILTNMHRQPVEGNFSNKDGKAIKPVTVEDYNLHVGHVNKGNRISNGHSISWSTWKWTKKILSTYWT
jgi:hypothetical protein